MTVLPSPPLTLRRHGCFFTSERGGERERVAVPHIGSVGMVVVVTVWSLVALPQLIRMIGE